MFLTEHGNHTYVILLFSYQDILYILNIDVFLEISLMCSACPGHKSLPQYLCTSDSSHKQKMCV